jgi:hypothetical protein
MPCRENIVVDNNLPVDNKPIIYVKLQFGKDN